MLRDLLSKINLSRSFLPTILFLSIFGLFSYVSVKEYDVLAESSRYKAQREIEIVVDDFKTNKSSIDLAFYAVRSFFESSDDVTKKEFYHFIESSRFLEMVPAMSSFSFSSNIPFKDSKNFIENYKNDKTFNVSGYPDFKIFPETDKMAQFILTYVYPENIFGKALGYNMHSDESRRIAIENARDKNEGSISKIVNVLPTGEQSFLYFLPVYNKDLPIGTLEERRTAFLGTVNGTFRANDFFSYFFDRRLSGKKISVRVYDLLNGRNQTEEGLMYFYNPSNINYGKANDVVNFFPRVTQNFDYKIGGRTWRFIFETQPAYNMSQAEIMLPFLTVLFGIFLGLTLSTILYILRYRNDVANINHYNKNLREQTEFIATISHQLKTPLSVLKIGIETVAQEIKDRDLAEGMKSKLNSINSIVNNLLFYLKYQKTGKIIKDDYISLSDVVAEIIGELDQVIASKRIKIEYHRAPMDDQTMMDKELLSRAIFFVIENAIIYSPEGEKITISVLDSNNTGVKIVISDHGYGIPLKEQALLFSKFFRASNASLGKNEGSGIGLYLSDMIVKNHGGLISVESYENKGSTFTIFLPKK
ncbi:MAG: CHASE domain-containing protein [Patescibacteria group bacterium]|nr:CHASE domain-containing protein [Patescibacteria group bacterium]